MPAHGRAERGSRRWLQDVVNDRPELLRRELAPALSIDSADRLEWRSPRREDDYREYRDAAFLTLLGLDANELGLREFWPSRGPDWDALGVIGDNGILLVEAKAHIIELRSPPTSAKDPASIDLITESLERTRRFLGGSGYVDWSRVFYQYTNRLAHLYFLRELNELEAWLVNVYFVGDADMRGPDTIDEWRGAISMVHAVLGISKRHPLHEYTIDVFIDIDTLSRTTDSGQAEAHRQGHL